MNIEKLIAKAVKKLKGKPTDTTEVVTWVPDFKRSALPHLVETKDYNKKAERLRHAVTLYNDHLAHLKLKLVAKRIGHGMSPTHSEWGEYLFLYVI